jgi:catechol 2,3-dioxygenase-like lactoylglutathione lyase family enzyme
MPCYPCRAFRHGPFNAVRGKRPHRTQRDRSARAFLPTKDFDTSKAFYIELGLTLVLEVDVAIFSTGESEIILTRFYQKEYAENFMMQVLVDDLDAWWNRILSVNLPERYLPERFGVPAPREPAMQPWRPRVAYVIDPSGVLWHFAERPEPRVPHAGFEVQRTLSSCLRTPAQEVEKLRLQVRPYGRLQLGPEDLWLANHGIHRFEGLIGLADGVFVESLVRTDRSCQVPCMDEHIHGDELADSLTRGDLAGRPIHLFGCRHGICGDFADRSRGVLPGLYRILVCAQGL